MHSSLIFSLAATQVLTSAHPSAIKRQECITSAQWSIEAFSAFTGVNTDQGANTPYSSIGFTFSNIGTQQVTQCAFSGSAVNPDIFYPCENASQRFKYAGNGIISLQETVACGSTSGLAAASTTMVLTCAPESLLVPTEGNVEGTVCKQGPTPDALSATVVYDG